MSLGIFLFLLLVCGAAQAFAHPHPEPSPGTPQAAAVPLADAERQYLQHLCRLFWDVALVAPGSIQPELLERAEQIDTLLNGPHGLPVSPQWCRYVSAQSRATYGRLRSFLPLVRTRLTTEGLTVTGQSRPVQLGRGIPSVALIEVENSTAAEFRAHVTSPGPAPPSPWIIVAPRQTGACLAALQADTCEVSSLDVKLQPEGTGLQEAHTPVAVTVREPAVIRGRALEEGGGLTPARIWVRCADGIYRHGAEFAGDETLSRKPVIFRPAWYTLPFFYTSGEFEVRVPPGPATVTLERGFEHLLVSRTLECKPGSEVSVTLRSGRFRDMLRLGWVSGDTHVHWVENNWYVNKDMRLLSLVQRAEDLRVANNLTLYQHRPEEEGGPFIKPDQYPMGPVPGLCGPEWHIQMGEEYRNDHHYGHVNLLNIRELIQPIATGPGSGGDEHAIDYPLNRSIMEEAHRQGGICCEAHNLGPYNASGVPVNVIHGLSDCLDQLEPEHYYRFLNSGIHIGLGNGSDHPARVVGCVRVYVYTGVPFTYEKWIQGLRAGRSFTTSGPLLFLTVNGSGPGETLDLEGGEILTVTARAISRFPIGRLEIVSNGEVLAAVSSQEREASVSIRVPADRSRWFVARCSRGQSFFVLSGPDIAHTSAVYARVGGREVIRRDAVQFWLDNIAIHRERLLARGNFSSDAQRQEALDYIDSGLARYRALLEQATQ
jgi:hypothetical protein